MMTATTAIEAQGIQSELQMGALVGNTGGVGMKVPTAGPEVGPRGFLPPTFPGSNSLSMQPLGLPSSLPLGAVPPLPGGLGTAPTTAGFGLSNLPRGPINSTLGHGLTPPSTTGCGPSPPPRARYEPYPTQIGAP